MLRSKLQHRLRRKRRIRARVRGTAERPRLSVYRSLRGMYVQLIDDNTGHTLVAASLKDLAAPARRSVPRSPKGEVGSTKGEGGKKVSVESAAKLGKVLAEKAKKKKIEKVVFDRNAYKYHGRVKALAEAARKGGLIF